jgi:hypothetical protein
MLEGGKDAIKDLNSLMKQIHGRGRLRARRI